MALDPQGQPPAREGCDGVDDPGYLRPTIRPRTAHFARAAILASAVLLMLPGAWGNSVTVVELAQLPAGLAAWQGGTLGIYRVCGPFSKLLYALPAYAAGVRVDYPASFDAELVGRQEWELGRLFQVQMSKAYFDIYRGSRLLPILLTVLGGCLICEWSTRLFGTWPGLISLAAWCWLPPVLGHGALVTSDMPSAVLTLLAARTFFSFLLRPKGSTAFLAGVALGLAQATKFTMLVLDPCWVVLLVIRALQPPAVASNDPSRVRESPIRWAALGLVVLATSVLVIDALYGFREVGSTLSEWRSGQSSLADSPKRLGEWWATAWLLRVPLPVPLELVRGIDVQLADTERLQSAYLLGRTELGGFWYWYAAASLLKVPLPTLVLFALALVRLPFARRKTPDASWGLLCVLMPAVEVALTISATTGTGTNAAFRYLLPSLGLLCVIAGCAWNPRGKLGRAVMAVLLGWMLLDAVAAAPDPIGAQNEAAWAWSHRTGRPALIGDSLDWGQDLARLSSWVSRHSAEGPTQLCVYGLGDSEPYGLVPPSALPSQPAESGPRAEFLAVSEGILFGDRITNDIPIKGARPTLDPDLVQKLQRLSPFGRVGRTIRIYRMRDVMPASRDAAIRPTPEISLASGAR